MERCVLINLTRRPDRLQQATEQLTNWPYIYPEIFSAVDGWGNPDYPSSYRSGKGSWGCRESHCRVLQQAIDDGIQCLCVLEDDLILGDTFAAQSKQFFDNVPDDWELVYLGGQHWRPPKKLGNGIVECRSVCRTHCYVAKQSAMLKMFKLWSGLKSGHIDNCLAGHLSEYRCYAPERWLVGQGGIKSDITCRREKVRFWNPRLNQKAIANTVATLTQKRQQVLRPVQSPVQPIVHCYRNRITGTMPIIFHGCGGVGPRNELFPALCRQALSLSIPPCNDLMVMTFTNSPNQGTLEKQLIKNKQPHLVLGRDFKVWKNAYKTGIALNALESVQQPFILILDGFDVCYHADLRATIHLLNESGKKLVMNGDRGIWPRDLIDKQYTDYQRAIGRGRWRYINSGAWITTREYGVEFLNKCLALQGDTYSDQPPYHWVFYQNPDIGIDYDCKVFQTDINTGVLE